MKFWELVKGIQEEGKGIPSMIKITDKEGYKYAEYIPDDFYDCFVQLLNSKDIEFEEGKQMPREGQDCYCVDQYGEIDCYVWHECDEECQYAYAHNNCFKSEKEAEEYLEYEKAWAEMEKPFVPALRNYHICYNTKRDCLDIGCCYDTNDAGVKYLGKNLDEVKGFVETWRKEILKYEFGIEEHETEIPF